MQPLPLDRLARIIDDGNLKRKLRRIVELAAPIAALEPTLAQVEFGPFDDTAHEQKQYLRDMIALLRHLKDLGTNALDFGDVYTKAEKDYESVKRRRERLRQLKSSQGQMETLTDDNKEHAGKPQSESGTIATSQALASSDANAAMCSGSSTTQTVGSPNNSELRRDTAHGQTFAVGEMHSNDPDSSGSDEMNGACNHTCKRANRSGLGRTGTRAKGLGRSTLRRLESSDDDDIAPAKRARNNL